MINIKNLTVNGKGSLLNGTTFIYPKGEEVAFDDLEEFIQSNGSLAKDYKANLDMYLGDHEILTDTTEKNGPNNKLVANLAHYIVDTFNGFFMGIPPKITIDEKNKNENLQQWNDTNSLQDKLNELSKQTDIYGRSFAFLYQNEDSETEIAYSSPLNAFMIYDDSIGHAPVAFVRYQYDEDNKLSGTVYLADEIKEFSSDGFIESDEPSVNQFGIVPAVEFYANEERQGVFENVKTLINGLDKALSQKANQNEYFDNGYLKILGADLDTDGDGKPDIDLTDNGIIYSPDQAAADAVVEFISKPDGDSMQEHLLDRLSSMIFQISMVPNLNDEAFSGNSSGVALQYKLLAMRNLAASKERKFTQSLRRLYRIAFKAGTILPEKESDSWQDLKFQFTRNMPVNLADEADTASKLQGIVSKETQLSTLSIVDDPKAEIGRMADEQKEADKQLADSNPANYDFNQQNNDKEQ